MIATSYSLCPQVLRVSYITKEIDTSLISCSLDTSAPLRSPMPPYAHLENKLRATQHRGLDDLLTFETTNSGHEHVGRGSVGEGWGLAKE